MAEIETETPEHAELRQAEKRRKDIIGGLAEAVCRRIDDAIRFRANLGVEDEWVEDEEFYQGIDDANRHEHPMHIRRTKPLEGGGSSTSKTKPYGSTIFINITAPYTDAASARVGDMLLPTDEKNWALETTPMPDISELLDWRKAVEQDQASQSNPNTPPPDVPTTPPAGMLGQMPEQEVTALVDKVQAIKDEAARRCKRAERRIEDWLAESDFTSISRQAIDDSARIGTGVVKGPIPKLCTSTSVANGVRETIQEYRPISKIVDIWDCFPDPLCGEDIHEGDFFAEREYLSESGVKALLEEAEFDEVAERAAMEAGEPPPVGSGYIAEELRAVLAEGPGRWSSAGYKSHTDELRQANQSERQRKENYEVFYYYGVIKTDEMAAAFCECDPEAKDGYAVITIINQRIVRIRENVNIEGRFPYDFIPWRTRKGMPYGAGVARDIRTPQRMVTAAARNLMNNAGLSSGLQIIFRRGVTPHNGRWEITPNKLWLAGDDIEDADKAFVTRQFPMLLAELTGLIQLGLKLAEDVTGFPALMQGQKGKAPDTVGGMQILNNNSNSVLRRKARTIDRYFTDPHLTRYYQYLMEFGPEDDEKGDYRVIARGSAALVERDIQNQEMVQVLQLSLQPAYEISPARAAEQYLQSRRFDPANFRFTEGELDRRRNQPPPKAPAVEAAEIRAMSAEKVAGIEAQVDIKRSADDTDRDAIYVKAESDRTQLEHQARMTEIAAKRELAMLDYANKRGMTLDKVKAELAKTAMTLNTQRDLAHINGQAKQVAKPAFEPKGRAPNGQAFQK